VRNIDDLIKNTKGPPTPEAALDEFNRKQYLEDVARLRDFALPQERMRWPNPIRPRWKN